MFYFPLLLLNNTKTMNEGYPFPSNCPKNNFSPFSNFWGPVWKTIRTTMYSLQTMKGGTSIFDLIGK